jgi:hypothetical protein
MAHWLRAVVVAGSAVLVAVAVSACSSAIAQTEEERGAGFTADEPIQVDNLYLPDGGTQPCHQLNIIGNDCRDPRGFPTACCLYYLPESTELSGPACSSFAPTLVSIQQVGKGFCCDLFPPETGVDGWRRSEDLTKPCDFCGGKTPKENECCTRDRNIVQKYPIVNKEDCPNPVQDLPDHPPSTNGCGSDEARRKGWGRIIPQGYGPIDWTPLCDVHDRCYSTCGSDKAACDGTIAVALPGMCVEYYGPLAVLREEEGDSDLAGEAWTNMQNCVGRAQTFMAYITDKAIPSRLKTWGQDAFDAAQALVCRCCQ